MKHDFEDVLKRFDNYIKVYDYDPDLKTLFGSDIEIIQLALLIADRLQNGEVSDDMYDVGDEMCMSFADRGEFTDAEEVFKAMSQQLFKECEDETSTD